MKKQQQKKLYLIEIILRHLKTLDRHLIDLSKHVEIGIVEWKTKPTLKIKHLLTSGKIKSNIRKKWHLIHPNMGRDIATEM